MAIGTRAADRDRTNGKAPDSMAGRNGQRPLAQPLIAALQQAVVLHQAGKLPEAAALYDHVLHARPTQPDALHLRGVIHHQQGDSETAVKLIRKALKNDPGNAKALINLGAALTRLGRHGEAGTVLVQAVQRLPDSAEAHGNLAAVRDAEGKLAEAKLLYRRALELNPTHAGYCRRIAEIAYAAQDWDDAAGAYRHYLELVPGDLAARNDFGVALEKARRPAGAIVQLRRVVEAQPDLAEAHGNLANALGRVGDIAGAERHHRRAAELAPQEWRFRANLAFLFWETGRNDEAEEIFRQILAEHPDRADLWQEFGAHLSLVRRHDKAEAALRRALDLDPNLAEAHNSLGNVLSHRGQYDDAIAAYQRAIACKPDYLLAHLNLCLVLQEQKRIDEAAIRAYGLRLLPSYDPVGCANRTLQILKIACDFDGIEALGDIWSLAERFNSVDLAQAFLTLLALAEDEGRIRQLVTLAHKLGAEQEAKAAPVATSAPTPVRRGRIRVGFVSSDFRNHSASKCIRPLFRNYDRDRFEIRCYSALPATEDPVQRELAGMVDSFASIDTLDDVGASKLIRADGVEVLFDLNGWTAHSRLPLFAYRPAPYQVAWLGWPFTAGYESIGHFLVDRFNAPAAPGLLFEQPLPVEGPWIAFEPLTGQAVSDPPFQRNGHLTFGTLNNTYKITRRQVALWARVLAAVPGSRFVMARPEARSLMLVRNLLTEFAGHGIAEDRVDIIGQSRNTQTHFPFYGLIDISLDTFPVTGGITTIDSLWMGVPVVSLHGPAFHQRIGHSLLNHAGLGEFSAPTPEAFVETACRLAADTDRLAEMRADLRNQLLASPLFDGAAFANNFGDAIESLVRGER
jgi:predicted O-linked N-acetylglucosamine transferase (SPINDLY family)